jgi:hypothetical protein
MSPPGVEDDVGVVHDLGEVGSVIVDHLAGTETADEIVLGRAGGGDDVGSGGAGDLDGQVADPATTAVAQREATKAALAQKIQADADDGLLPADTDARALATFYAAVIQGMNTQACDGASHEDLEAIAEIALRAWPA